MHQSAGQAVSSLLPDLGRRVKSCRNPTDPGLRTQRLGFSGPAPEPWKDSDSSPIKWEPNPASWSSGRKGRRVKRLTGAQGAHVV